jgi:hypothetical protein
MVEIPLQHFGTFSGLLSEVSERKNKIKIAALLITLLQGPVDVGM